MKHKILNAALIITSVMAYLEWGKGNSIFLLFAEAEIIMKLFISPLSAVHPFTVVPLIGQIMLLITLFQKQPDKALTYIGMGCIALLLFFIFFIGILSANVKIFLSALPFVITCVLTVIYLRKHRKQAWGV